VQRIAGFERCARVRSALPGAVALASRASPANNHRAMSDAEPIELEPSTGTPLRADLRPPMPEPPPVRVIAVNDVHLPAAIRLEAELDAFYVGILNFATAREAGAALSFAAENVDLVFDLAEPPVDRDNLAPTMLEVPSLRKLRELFLENEIGYETMHGLMPGTEHIIVRDPAGNLLAISGWTLFS
jgi:hypothetical protein